MQEKSMCTRKAVNKNCSLGSTDIELCRQKVSYFIYIQITKGINI